MKIIFLDFDGVLVTLGSIRRASGMESKADPACVEALNEIIRRSTARIVVSSSWRGHFKAPMERILKSWGVRGKVVGVTPHLSKQVGLVWHGAERGTEIQAFLDSYKRAKIESFVILDDESDMTHLEDRLIQTNFETGLTMTHAERAISMLG